MGKAAILRYTVSGRIRYRTHDRILRFENMAILGAKLQFSYWKAALSIDQKDMSFVGTEEEVLAPLPEGNQERKQTAAFLRQDIFPIGTAVGRRDSIHDPVSD
jgi:hypothetical protein